MELIGYIASLLIGILLGLIGGGGSILTLPVLVYLFGLQPVAATSYSLFIVGSTSLMGAFNHLLRGLVNTRAVLFFGITSIVTVLATRRFIIHVLPDTVFTVAGRPVRSEEIILILFGILMIVSSFLMIRGFEYGNSQSELQTKSVLKMLAYGATIGLITGLLGAGGGFLLIPALVLLLKLPMKKAIGTSLMIIALNSLLGFAGDLPYVSFDWSLLIKITVLAIAGIVIGMFIGKRIPSRVLRKGFGWFVFFMGIYMLLTELVTIF